MPQRFRGLYRQRYPLQMRCGAERPQLGAFVVWRTHLQARHRCAQLLNQRIVNTFLGIDTAGGGTVLTRVVVAKGPYPLHHRVEVGIVKDDNRRFAPQLHVGAFH